MEKSLSAAVMVVGAALGLAFVTRSPSVPAAAHQRGGGQATVTP